MIEIETFQVDDEDDAGDERGFIEYAHHLRYHEIALLDVNGAEQQRVEGKGSQNNHLATFLVVLQQRKESPDVTKFFFHIFDFLPF